MLCLPMPNVNKTIDVMAKNQLCDAIIKIRKPTSDVYEIAESILYLERFGLWLERLHVDIVDPGTAKANTNVANRSGECAIDHQII